jgi:replicative DNA helicase
MVQLESPATVSRSAAEVLEALRSGDVRGDDLYHTGFNPLDGALDGGLRARSLVLVGGLPGIGKTVLALQWARSLAKEGHDVVFASYEHDESSLLARLLLLEAAETNRFGAGERRALLQEASSGAISFDDAVTADPGLAKTRDRFAEYAPRIWLARGNAHTGLEELEELVAGLDQPALFVDYLQKVPFDGAATNADRVIRVSEGLKDLALRRSIPVVAIVAADGKGLTSRRLRTHHFRGSSALAFEADVVIILNDKFDAVSKRHTSFDAVRAESFKSQVVFTIEKNRDGPAPLDLEFRKDFEHYRFEPEGGYVAERLVDERFFTE